MKHGLKKKPARQEKRQPAAKQMEPQQQYRAPTKKTSIKKAKAVLCRKKINPGAVILKLM